MIITKDAFAPRPHNESHIFMQFNILEKFKFFVFK